MIYLKNLNGQVKGYKDTDTKTVEALLDSGRWEKVKGLKDLSPYVVAKQSTKKASKKKSK